ncbi:hypothetical protein [Labrenzia sp. DG1229]|uniref:hypothetical protein n=1 Tax=Labrenzia sp. DG1229 TaxID=681847 RepID=UPI0004901D6F|nr:hypothetical protein [Labrenzia sp. DG1229]
MKFELMLMGTAIHLLVWDKLPEWGTWFKTLLGKLPRPLQLLYDQWHCPYCAGFWIALALHALTGFWTLPGLANLPSYLGILREAVAWTLDALATATLIYAAILTIKAIGLPAMKAHMMKAEFLKSAFPAQVQDE